MLIPLRPNSGKMIFYRFIKIGAVQFQCPELSDQDSAIFPLMALTVLSGADYQKTAGLMQHLPASGNRNSRRRTKTLRIIFLLGAYKYIFRYYNFFHQFHLIRQLPLNRAEYAQGAEFPAHLVF
jgi:hypothetical protein